MAEQLREIEERHGTTAGAVAVPGRCDTQESPPRSSASAGRAKLRPLLAATEITFTEEEIKTIDSAKVVSINELLTPETISAD